jgi:hypothetical protein
MRDGGVTHAPTDGVGISAEQFDQQPVGRNFRNQFLDHDRVSNCCCCLIPALGRIFAAPAQCSLASLSVNLALQSLQTTRSNCKCHWCRVGVVVVAEVAGISK